MQLKTIILLIVIIVGGIRMNGQEMVTDRPDQTESASTVLKGSLQIESGLLLSFSEENNMTLQSILAPTTLFRVGLTLRESSCVWLRNTNNSILKLTIIRCLEKALATWKLALKFS